MDPFEYLNSLPALGIKMGFARIKPILEEMGTPEGGAPAALVGWTQELASPSATSQSALR